MENQKNGNGETKDLVPIHDELDIFKKFDELDDQIILDEIQERAVDVWVYHFVQDKTEVWGLAKEGVDQCAILMGKKGIALREDSVEFAEDPKSPEHVIFTAKVSKVLVDSQGNEARVETAIGTKRQSIMRKIKTREHPFYKFVTNPFWAEQGSMKAIRNAKMRLIPAEIKAKVIANAKIAKGKIKTVKGKPIEQKEEKPKPVEKKSSPKPEPKENNNFPDDEESQVDQEQISMRDASTSQRNKVTGLMQTLVDKYGLSPDDILEKMDTKAGSHDISEYSEMQASAVIEYFEWVIKELDKKKKG